MQACDGFPAFRSAKKLKCAHATIDCWELIDGDRWGRMGAQNHFFRMFGILFFIPIGS